MNIISAPNVGAISGSTGICVGSVTVATDTTTGGSWSSSNNSVGAINAITGILNAVSQGIDTIYYSVTSGTGCTAHAMLVDTVYAVPVAAPITGGTSVCQGSTLTLANSVLFGTWSSSNTSVATIGSSSGVVTGAMVGTTKIIYVVNNMCGSVSDSMTLNVVTQPVVSPISGPTTTVCAGATTEVVDATGGGHWSSSDTTIATVGSTTGIVTGTNAGSVTITYTVSSAGCSSDATFTINFGSTIGSGSISPSSSAICNGHSVLLQALTAGGGFTYQWERNGSNIAGANTFEYSADSAGSYSCVISNGTCQETLGGATVSILSNPIVSFTAPSTLSTGAYTSYQWYRNNVAIPGATSSVYHEGAAGTYKVVVSDGGCSDTSAAYVIHASGGGGGGGGTYVTTVNRENITFYPNPAQSVLHIESPVLVSINILSPDGRVVLHSDGQSDIDVSGLAAGIYILQAYNVSNQILVTGKFVKQ